MTEWQKERQNNRKKDGQGESSTASTFWKRGYNNKFPRHLNGKNKGKTRYEKIVTLYELIMTITESSS